MYPLSTLRDAGSSGGPDTEQVTAGCPWQPRGIEQTKSEFTAVRNTVKTRKKSLPRDGSINHQQSSTRDLVVQ